MGRKTVGGGSGGGFFALFLRRGLLRVQGASDQYQVGQSEKGVELRRVFGQALLAYLAVAEEVLDDVKRMLDQGAHLRLGFFHG